MCARMCLRSTGVIFLQCSLVIHLSQCLKGAQCIYNITLPKLYIWFLFRNTWLKAHVLFFGNAIVWCFTVACFLQRAPSALRIFCVLILLYNAQSFQCICVLRTLQSVKWIWTMIFRMFLFFDFIKPKLIKNKNICNSNVIQK